MITFGKIFEAAEEIEARVDKGLSEGILICLCCLSDLHRFSVHWGKGGAADNGLHGSRHCANLT